MSIKIINNLDIIVYIGIENEEKIPIFNKEFHELSKEGTEFSLRVSEVYEDFQDKVFKFSSPCVLKIEANLEVYMEKAGIITKLKEEKIKENKKEKEEPVKPEEPQEKVVEVKKTKVQNFYFETFKKGNFVFIGNDREKYFKIKKICRDEKKIEFVLSDLGIVEEKLITIDPFKHRLSQMVNFNYKLIFFDDRFLERTIQVNINSTAQDIQDSISKQIEKFIKSKDYRFTFQGQDISQSEINNEIFRHKTKEEEEQQHTNKKQKRKNKKKKKQDESLNEPINLAGMFGEDEDEDEEDQDQANKKSDTEEAHKKINSHNNSKTYISKDANEKDKALAELEKLTMKGRMEKVKNLCELNFNFKKDYFTIIVPDTKMKTCNLFETGSYDYTSGLRNQDIINLFIFGSSIKVKNFCICGAYEGGIFNSIDLLIYESTFKKKKYANEKELNLSYKYNVSSLLDLNLWQKQRLIYEKKNIVIKKNFPDNSDVDLEKIYYKSYIVETDFLEFDKDKIYSFIFRLKENPNGDYLYYFTKSESSFYKKMNEELDLNAFTNRNTWFYLFGFDYKMK